MKLSALLLVAGVITIASGNLNAGEKLEVGSCFSDEGKQWHLCLRKQELQLHRGPDASTAEKVAWSSPKVKDAALATVEGGSLVVKNARGTVLWSTETTNGDTLVVEAQRLVLQQSGYVYNSAVWTSEAAATAEKATGVVFQPAMTFGGQQYVFCGAGVREKAIVGPVAVKVYALALFVSQADATRALSRFTGKSASVLASDASYFRALKDLPRKYVHLVFVRSVGAQKVVDSLTSLSGVPKQSLDSFAKLLMNAIGSSVANGQSISLGAEGSSLVVFFDGKRVGEVKDAALAPAVFELYLGQNAVSPSAKAGFAAALPGLLATS